MKQGKELFYDESGKLIGEAEFNRGVPINSHLTRHPNGQKARVAKYDAHGELKEPIIEYADDGSKRLQYWLLNGLYDGELVEWHPQQAD